MPKITRRHSVVTLYQGRYEAELASLLDQVMAAKRREELAVSEKRFGSKSAKQAEQLAAEHDALAEKAHEDAVDVDLWAISYRTWDELSDRHPPREDNKEDAAFGVNRDAFVTDLLLASLVDPESGIRDTSDLLARGQGILDDLGDLSRLHYAKLERGAWAVNTEDDALPKYSLVSLLRAGSEPDSEPLNDSE